MEPISTFVKVFGDEIHDTADENVVGEVAKTAAKFSIVLQVPPG